MTSRFRHRSEDLDMENIFLVSKKDFVDDRVEIPLATQLLFCTLIVALVTLGIFGMQVIYLNVFRGSVFAAMAKNDANITTRMDAPRGIITDRFGNEIVNNTTGFDVIAYPKQLPPPGDERTHVIEKTAELLGVSPSDIETAIQGAENKKLLQIPLAYHIDTSHALLFQSLALPGIVAQERYVRNYIDGQVFSSVTGYVGLANEDDLSSKRALAPDDYVGRAGVEQYYNSLLRGIPGEQILSTSQQSSLPLVLPQQGSNITLTIDGDLQRYMYTRLVEAQQSLHTDGAAGIVMNVRNGEVLGMVSLPSYDPSWFLDAAHTRDIAQMFNNPLHPLFNRVVSGTYSPGSTIKPLMAFAALREGVITTNTIVGGHGGKLVVPNPYDPSNPSIFRDWKVHGDVDVKNAIAQSDNIFFYTVGGGAYGIHGLGADKIKHYWEMFQLGSKTGIDMPQEMEGLLPDPAWKKQTSKIAWRIGDTYNISIGQGALLLTPIQIVRYIAAIANNGFLVSPHVVQNQTRDADRIPVLALSDIDKQWLSVVQEGMQLTVTSPEGSAYLLHDIPMPIAAKTGSAQIDWNTKTNALFVGYAPADNPEIAILILIENAKSSTLNAVPVAKDILLWYYNNREHKN
ncbi:MAG: penicillin-binding protein 2 [Patescibacteria group bacterium]|nr:penicillin-binding protein 2 [Patescibacteria group bacterium]MDE2437885.1 penicillin-binding protein 2 [Patescibacteria group bacterium]